MLSEVSIDAAEPAEKPRKLHDSSGLYLLLNPNGSRWWRLDYRHRGKRKTISMGVFPDTDLVQAREKRNVARKLLARGIDPGEMRKAARAAGDGLHEWLPHPATPTARPLQALGIDEMEERVYRTLLAHPMISAKEIADHLGLSARGAQMLLDRVELHGLSTHSPELPRRYVATPPELAVEALASQRQADIERARLAIPELKEHAVTARSPEEPAQFVELITNRAALSQIVMQLHQTLQHEAFGFQRAPMLTPSRQETMQPGIRIRSVSDRSYLELPDAMNSLKLVTQMGEEARIFPALPVKMFIADRRIGLIPLNIDDPNGPILLVRSCALLDALCSLFEHVWERSTPVVFGRDGRLELISATTRISDAAEQVIPLLAAGLHDKAIAYETGVSATTLNRRISELMKRFDTRTRFQLGWRAALDAFPERLPHALPKKQPPKVV